MARSDHPLGVSRDRPRPVTVGGVLAELKSWMAAHNAAIMAVLCLVIGAKLIGDAVTGLS